MFHLEVNQLHKSYGDTKVFEGRIRHSQELVTLLGLRLQQIHPYGRWGRVHPVDGGQCGGR